MLPGICGIMAGLGQGLLVEQTYSAGAAATSFSGASFGPDTTGRGNIFLVWHGDRSVSPGLTPSLTINGSATGVARYQPHSTGDDTSGNDACGTAIFTAAPGGTSGDIAVNWGGGIVTLVILRTVGYSITPYTTWGNSTGSANTNINVSTNNSAMIGIAAAGQNSNNLVWTGITERGQTALMGANNVESWAFDYKVATNASRNVQVSPWSSAQGSNSWSGIVLAPT
ncbi:hypothetical protein EJ074_20560 [Mesorhizobium sp. M3A.F.Ca.ET.080.04.2.1]|uniref:hypothetical protein n=1 Tax=Mesorhizobium sp. M3A.F.Ca.ET.080.04.2.1 TaxID=2493676 RepID=UPI000F75D904|nr:hypothetical protein [Mesorhizobium sp. M3A.F.Ca.ET.080.04.2.1]AZO11213.1 hypothetical protein EJ074_20560 [Mesorhizobium sp. M3A.F.Ca.ET.080.04.2.1]RWF23777.1 MAG: hypothetical protein EOS64_10010 [Mesorhizobium sp.]